MSTIDLAEMRTVAVADVYKSGVRAARLRRTSAGVEFNYLDDYSGEPIATTLPQNSVPLITPAGAIPPFFTGLLPEGRRLTALRRQVKTSADDEFSLLLAVGSDTIGDVVVVPENHTPSAPDVKLEVSADFSNVRFSDILVDVGMVDTVGIPGVQDKVSARVISMPLRTGSDRFILKLDPPEYPHLVANEAYFSEIARRSGMDVADTQIVHDADGNAGLLVKRFDRQRDAAGDIAFACEDACQLLNRWPADKYNTTIEAVTQAVMAVSAAETVAARDVFRQVVFAWLTGNGDLHAKNVSVLNEGSEWKVSPAYDLPSTVFYGDTTMALPVQGSSKSLSRKQLFAYADAVGLPTKAAQRVLDETLDGTSAMITEIRDGMLPFNEHQTRDAARLLRYRRNQLAN